jgi:hypothetical protein
MNLHAIEAKPVLFIATAKVPSRKYARAVSAFPPIPPINTPIVSGIDIPADNPPTKAAIRRDRTMFRFMRQRADITITEITTGFVISIITPPESDFKEQLHQAHDPPLPLT